MTEREHELTEMVERRTGDHLPTIGDALDEPPAPTAAAYGRARRAGA